MTGGGLSRRRLLAGTAVVAGLTGATAHGRRRGPSGPDRDLPPTAVELARDPDDPELLAFRVRVEVPESIRSLSLTVREEVSIGAADNLAEHGATRLASIAAERLRSTPTDYHAFTWDAPGRECELAFELDVSERLNEVFHGRDFAGTDEWVFAPLPELAIWFRRGRGLRVRRFYPLVEDLDSVAIESGVPWIAGKRFLLLGRYRSITREREGTAFTLVRPRETRPRSRFRSIFESLGDAVRRLPVGSPNETVVTFLMPDPLRGGGRAYGQRQFGAHDRDVGEFYVHERSSSVETPNNVWIHEYVHTRQAFRPATGTRWFVEASAEYYAALLTYLQGRADAGRTVSHLRPGESVADATLTAPEDWPGPRVPYAKGGWVLLGLDRRLREFDGSLVDVFRRVNGRSHPVTYERFRRDVTAVGGDALREWCDDHVDGPARPSRLADADPETVLEPFG